MSLEISALIESLREHFDFNLARIRCLGHMVLSLIEARDINLVRIAQFFNGNAILDSSYKRIQRFIKAIKFDAEKLAEFLLKIMCLINEIKLGLIVDRTNWEIGKIHINILYLAISHDGIAIPLFGFFSKTKNKGHQTLKIVFVY
jgi:hypothetical protein